MMQLVFDKTDKGREEIATRRYQLAAKVRSILLLVDGKQSGEVLLQKYAGIGVSGQALQDLIDGGFISPRAEAGPAAASATVATTATTVTAATPATAPASTALIKTVAQAATITLAEGQTQHQAIYQFYCETIKANLGLRGLPLQLKVEKCSTVDELRALRTTYLEAVLKARDTETARSLRDRLDLLLNLQSA